MKCSCEEYSGSEIKDYITVFIPGEDREKYNTVDEAAWYIAFHIFIKKLAKTESIKFRWFMNGENLEITPYLNNINISHSSGFGLSYSEKQRLEFVINKLLSTDI